MLTAMGLALGIDYSLFVLARYREERLHGRERPDAIAAVGATASRAVLFSGIAFTLAMVGMCWCRARSCAASPPPRSGGARLGRGGSDATAGAHEPARGPRQRPADPVLRTRRGPRGEPVLGSHGTRSDAAAADQPRAGHGNPACDGRARARSTVRRGRREHAAGPARR